MASGGAGGTAPRVRAPVLPARHWPWAGELGIGVRIVARYPRMLVERGVGKHLTRDATGPGRSPGAAGRDWSVVFLVGTVADDSDARSARHSRRGPGPGDRHWHGV